METYMSKEILVLVDSISREKGLNVEEVFNALEGALAFAAKKKLGGEALVDVEIDRKTGAQTVFRVWRIVETESAVENDQTQIARSQVPDAYKAAEEFEQEIEVDLGRQSAQLVKQAIGQKLKDVEQKSALGEVQERGESLHWGTVKVFKKGGAILEIGRLEAFLPKSEMLPKDFLKVGQRIRVAIKEVEQSGNTEQVIVSRATPEFMRLLIASEVVQVEDGEIEILKLARVPGVRCKMIVRQKGNAGREEMEREGRQQRGRGIVRDDPARIIIGNRGVHAKAIAEETGENIDVIVDDPDFAQLLIKIFSPAEPLRISIDEEAKTVDIELSKDSLGLAIGNRGANIRLVSDLLGWRVDVMDETEWLRREAVQAARSIETLSVALEVEEDIAAALNESGFGSVEEVAYCPAQELVDVGFDEDSVALLRSRARKFCEHKQNESQLKAYPAKESLAKIPGITEEEIELLVKAEVYGSEELADLATDELLEVVPRMKPQRAQTLIMAARNVCWG